MSKKARYARQVILSQIGEAGQERLLASCLVLSPDLDPGTRAMTERYALAAGVGSLSVAPSGATAQALPDGLQRVFRHPASRSVGWGAAFALAHSLRALALTPSEDRG